MKNDKYKKDEIKIINIQIIATSLFIISLLISLLLTFNDKLIITNKQKIFSKKTTKKLSLYNRILIVILASTFIYTNYKTEKIAEARNQKNINLLKLQMVAGEFSLIGSLIILYIVYKSQNDNNLTNTENPNI